MNNYEDDEYEIYNIDWINDVEEKEKDYYKYYVGEQEGVNLYFLFLSGIDNGISEVKEVKKVYYKFKELGIIRWMELVPYILKVGDMGYSLCKMLRYHYKGNPEEIINDKYNVNVNNNHWNNIELTMDVYFEDTIRFMQDLSSIIFILQPKQHKIKSKKVIDNNSRTRRVYCDVRTPINNKTRRNNDVWNIDKIKKVIM